MTTILQQLLACLDAIAEYTGRAVAWLTLAMMLITCLVVVLRYVFSINFIAIQESLTYLHALVFLLAMGFTLRRDGHVRVDILYRKFSPRRQAWVNAIGGLVLLLPLCGFILASSWGFTLASWRILESSGNADGIPAVFLLKSLIPLAALLLALQGLAEVLRALLTLQQDAEDGA